MRYFYQDQNHPKLGPYSIEELRQLHLSGVIKPETPVVREDTDSIILFKDLWASSIANESRPAATTTASTGAADESFTQRAGADLRALIPHLLMPLKELRTFSWLENRKLLFIAAVGLLPLFIKGYFRGKWNVEPAFWAVAFYFSVLWAMFFYYFFPTPQVKVAYCVGCFFGTGIISISLLLLAYRIEPLLTLAKWADPANASFLERTVGYILGVGLPEETCKALVLLVVARQLGATPPQVMLFYGLMSGLGFGIYEGVDYQQARNLRYSSGNPAMYHLLNTLRLTSLPFLHAIWTGMAGYFIGFAKQFPERKRGLLIVAIGLPAVLHGIYDLFGSAPLGLACATISLFALYLYLAKSVEFEKAFARDKS